MSTDHQTYSPQRQREAIGAYAKEHGYRIVRTYADEARSGLNIAGRPALGALLDDVANGTHDFAAVLVYDVSRWGRFQDTDESAYYEYVCRRAGIRVEYCMEPLCNDGTPLAAVVKAVKRIMAGEYSRELSEKIATAKLTQVRLGFLQGTSAGYGLRRMVLDPAGKPKGILQFGESKYVQNDRVVLVLGPAKERKVVQWMFRRVIEGEKPREIARKLNVRGLKTQRGTVWTEDTVRGMITNEKYAGTLVYNKTTSRLSTREVANPREKWIRVEGAVPAIIDRKTFDGAQRAISGWTSRISDEDAIKALREVYAKHGRLTTHLIDGNKSLPNARYYVERFGGLQKVYDLVGCKPARDLTFLVGYGWRRRGTAALREDVIAGLRNLGASALAHRRTSVVVSGRIRLHLRVAQLLPWKDNMRCQVALQSKTRPDWLLVAAMGYCSVSVDQYILAPGDMRWYLFGTPPEWHPERFSSKTLQPLIELLALPGGPPIIPPRRKPNPATRSGNPGGNAGTRSPRPQVA